MNILLTGATGKVGSRLLPRLLGQGHRVSALARDAERARGVLGAGVPIVAGDLLEPESLVRALEDMQTVIHCAAFFRGASNEQAQATNMEGTLHLAQAARAAGVSRFIFASTGLVYGPSPGRRVDEDADCAPVDAYPLSKLAAEKALLAMEALDVRVLRFPFIYGDGDPHIEEIAGFARGFAPDQRMSIAHHQDIAQGLIRLLETRAPAHRIYNVVDDEAPTIAELLAAVGQPAPDGSQAERGAAFGALMDGSRIRQDLGFEPRFPRLQDAIDARAL